MQAQTTESPEFYAAVAKIEKALEGLPPDTQRKTLEQLIQLEETEAVKKRTERDQLKAQLACLDDVLAWAESNRSFVLESNDCSRLHHLRDAAKNGRLIGADGAIEGGQSLSEHPQHTFVVKHDWGRAFENAEGIDDSIRLPYEICGFEFRIGGRSLIAVAYDASEGVKFTAFIQCREYWASVGGKKDIESHVIKMMWDQIRAICIALDAEVATETVVRAPHKLNEKRARDGKPPLPDYRVVDLARRHRVANPLPGSGIGNKKRMHFRRGHWRHFETTKTWVRWCLVGDPDLGFIQKHYSL